MRGLASRPICRAGSSLDDGAEMIPEIEHSRLELETVCRRHRVLRLELFGSAASGAFEAGNSDLDFLVEFEPPIGTGYADRYFGLLEALEALFQRPVDLVVESAITNPYFRMSAGKTKVLLYAA